MTRALAIGFVGIACVASVGLVLAPDWLERELDEPEVQAPRVDVVAAPAISALTALPVDPAIAELLGRSPFDTQRGAFTRETPLPPPPPPAPPRLLGVSTTNGKRVATVQWPSTGSIQRLSEGDMTELGKVVSVGPSNVVLKSKDAELTVSMY